MKKQTIISALITLVGLILTSCYWHNWEKINPTPVVKTCTLPDTVSYSKDIVPILTANCSLNNSACHSSSASSSGGDMTTYQRVVNNFCSGDSLSDMYKAITWSDPSNTTPMPENSGKLSQCDINKIVRWLDQGTPNN